MCAAASIGIFDICNSKTLCSNYTDNRIRFPKLFSHPIRLNWVTGHCGHWNGAGLQLGTRNLVQRCGGATFISGCFRAFHSPFEVRNRCLVSLATSFEVA